MSIHALAFLSTPYHRSRALSAGTAARFSCWMSKRRPTWQFSTGYPDAEQRLNGLRFCLAQRPPLTYQGYAVGGTSVASAPPTCELGSDYTAVRYNMADYVLSFRISYMGRTSRQFGDLTALH
jgi:hypothetical protein